MALDDGGGAALCETVTLVEPWTATRSMSSVMQPAIIEALTTRLAN
jgi:hypothetical protein